MTARKTTVTVKFSKPGIQPPVYLAGSFSDPAWQPKQMHFTAGEHNVHKFHSDIEVEEGKEYQYKFRVGEGGSWALDEDSPTVTDDLGNRNNLLSIPLSKQPINTEGTQRPSLIPSTDDTSSTSRTASKMDPQPTTGINNEIVTTGENGKKLDGKAHKSTTKREETRGPVPVSELSRPALIVEKTDPAPRYGENFGDHATLQQKEAYKMRELDATPDNVIIRDEATINTANTAAEVADAAAALDIEPPTPPVTDEEAGRIGLRRLSQTPIADVAAIASEVSESAALLDKEEPALKIEMPPPFAIGSDNSDGETGSGEVTPWEDRAPLFAHESIRPPSSEVEVPRSPRQSGRSSSSDEESIDLNDPSIEEFPCERHLILERVRTSATRLSEDETVFEGVSSSPVVAPKPRSESFDGGSSSSGLMASEPRTPSLNSIIEEHDYREETASALRSEIHGRSDSDGVTKVEPEVLATHKEESEPTVDAYESNSAALQQGAELTQSTVPPQATATGVGIREVTCDNPAAEPARSKSKALSVEHTMDGAHVEQENFPFLPSPSLDSKRQLGGEPERRGEIISSAKGPTVTIQPATPSPSLKNWTSYQFENAPADSARTTATGDKVNSSQLSSRKTPPPAERPLTPNSMQSASIAAKSRNFLKNLLRLVFVDWIGGIIKRLCGRGRHA